MQLESCIVDNLCAIAIVVLPFLIFSRECWINSSVSESIFSVSSSIIIILGLHAKVIAKVLKGADTKTMPIVLANEGVIYLNEAKAKQLGIEIPQDIKNKAKVVDKK